MHSKSLNFIYKIKQFSGDKLLGSFDCINAIFGITLHSNIVYIQLACQNNNCLVNCFLCLGKDVGIDLFHIGKHQNPSPISSNYRNICRVVTHSNVTVQFQGSVPRLPLHLLGTLLKGLELELLDKQQCSKNKFCSFLLKSS